MYVLFRQMYDKRILKINLLKMNEIFDKINGKNINENIIKDLDAGLTAIREMVGNAIKTGLHEFISACLRLSEPVWPIISPTFYSCSCNCYASTTIKFSSSICRSYFFF